jgi:nucleotide-binding universal stress UspA family protein
MLSAVLIWGGGETADAADLKSAGAKLREGSIPSRPMHEKLSHSGRAFLFPSTHPPDWPLIRDGEPRSEIESLACQLGVDLIVMGRVGQRGPRRILIGSVTERALEYAPCPVLIVSGKA